MPQRIKPAASKGENFSHAVLDLLKTGIVLLDQQARVVHANASARVMIECSDVLSVDRNGFLRTPGENQALLDSHITEALQGLEGKPGLAAIGTLGLREHFGRTPLMLSIVPLTDAASSDQAGVAMVAIFLNEPGSQRSLATAYLRQMHSLSPRELQICELFVNGHGLAAVAAHCGIAISSLRTYLKRIFSKTGCSSQAELMRLLAGLTVDFRDVD